MELRCLRAWGTREGLEAGVRWGLVSMLKDLSGHSVDGGEQDGSLFPSGQGTPFSIGQIGYSLQDRTQKLEKKQQLENTEGENGRGNPRKSPRERSTLALRVRTSGFTHSQVFSKPLYCVTGAAYKPFPHGP